MLSTKDYTKLSLEELESAEQKLKANKSTNALIVGVILGIAIYAATRGSFVLTVMLMIIAFMFASSNAQNLKTIQAEISRRKTEG